MQVEAQQQKGGTSSPTESPTMLGTFQIKVLEDKKERDDPWARNYVSTPSDTRVERTYPLRDLRPHVFGGGEESNGAHDAWSWERSAALLTKYGFTAVKYDTSRYMADEGETARTTQYWDNLDALERDYFPQVQESIVRLTGAKKVFITNSIVRRGDLNGIPRGGKTAPHLPANQAAITPSSPAAQDTAPKGTAPDTATKCADRSKQEHKALHDNRPTHLKSSDQAKPSRVPHMDYTPLGARISIRRWRPDIYQAAVDAGVISVEDEICTSHQVDPQHAESNPVIDANYNIDGELGPRYAAYSVWRPLRTVTRDPLAMAPRRSFNGCKDLIFDKYQLRMLAAPSMKGDFLRELEALAIPKEQARESAGAGSDPEFYYLSEQKPDEVIVLKFFDSAALSNGNESMEEAPSVPHASPDIGDAAFGAARESIEVRCIAFW